MKCHPNLANLAGPCAQVVFTAPVSSKLTTAWELTDELLGKEELQVGPVGCWVGVSRGVEHGSKYFKWLWLEIGYPKLNG